MDLSSYLGFLKKIVSIIPFGTFDYLVFAGMTLYIIEDAAFGLLAGGIGFASTISSFFIGLALYHPLSRILVDQFSLTKGIADAIAFLIVTMVSFTLISFILTFLRQKYLVLNIPKKLDMVGGAFFGLISFFFIALFAVSFLISFPTSAVIKNSIKESVTGKFLVSRTHIIEGYVRQVFGGAIDDTINFLTIKPSSDESVALNFKTRTGRVDEASEAQMLTMMNRERKKAGFGLLTADEELARVARDHARDMLERGYFSHYTPEGLSPFDRMEEAGIVYQFAGENLAFAPDVEIAMEGLMKSPGHRANILSPNFKKAGIGVIDAGLYGKMFVQEFTD